MAEFAQPMKDSSINHVHARILDTPLASTFELGSTSSGHCCRLLQGIDMIKTRKVGSTCQAAFKAKSSGESHQPSAAWPCHTGPKPLHHALTSHLPDWDDLVGI